MTIHLTVACVLTAALSWLPTPALAAPQDLDPTFGVRGVAVVDTGQAPDAVQNVIVGADFVYVLASAGTIVRFTPDGELDPEFGDHGLLTFDDLDMTVTAIAEDPAGGLFVGGNRQGSVVVARIAFDGTLDTAFAQNTAGFSVLGIPGDGEVKSIRFFQLKIIVLGTTATPGGDFRDAFIARVQQNGDPDFGWGFRGVSLLNFGTACDEASTFAVDRSQAFLVLGDTSFGTACTGGDLVVAKLDSVGALDPSLGDTGIRIFDLGGTETAGVVVSQTDTGKIAFSALSKSAGGAVQQVIGRLSASGKLDASFNGNGRLAAAFPAIPGFTPTGTVGVQSGGQLVYAGTTGSDVGVVRLEGSPQLSIDDFPSNSGSGSDGADPTQLSGGGSGSFGWISLAVLGLFGGLARWARRTSRPRGQN